MKYLFIIPMLVVNMFASNPDFEYECWSYNYGLEKNISLNNYNILLKGHDNTIYAKNKEYFTGFKNYNELIVDLNLDLTKYTQKDLTAYLPMGVKDSQVKVYLNNFRNEALLSISIIGDYNQYFKNSVGTELEIGKFLPEKNFVRNYQKLKTIYLPNMLNKTQKEICEMQYKQDMFMEWGKLVPYFIGGILFLMGIIIFLVKRSKKNKKKTFDASRIKKIEPNEGDK